MIETLLSWGVVSVVIPFVVGFGWGFLAMSDYKLAKACFILAAIIAEAKIVMWGISTSRNDSLRVLICFVAFGLFGVLAVEAVRYVDKKRGSALKASQAPPEAKPEQSPKPPVKPKTLRELYATDFDAPNRPVMMQNENIITLKEFPSEPVTISTSVIIDTDTKTKFIAYYIPNTEHTYKICELLSDGYKTTLAHWDGFTFEQAPPGERPTDSRNMSFTGRIFIYHEAHLFSSDVDMLLGIYRKKGLDPQFRGPEYAAAKNNPPAAVASPSTDKRAYQYELISRWRKMVHVAEREYKNVQSSSDSPSFAEVLEGQPDYLSLKPHLSAKTLEALREEKTDDTIIIVEMGRKHVINPPDDLISMLIDDIARKEATWDLI